MLMKNGKPSVSSGKFGRIGVVNATKKSSNKGFLGFNFAVNEINVRGQ